MFASAHLHFEAHFLGEILFTIAILIVTRIVVADLCTYADDRYIDFWRYKG